MLRKEQAQLLWWGSQPSSHDLYLQSGSMC